MMRDTPNQYLAAVVLPCLRHLNWGSSTLCQALAVIPFVARRQEDSEERYGPYLLSHEQHWNLWDDYLANRPELASKIRGLASQHRFIDNPDLELSLNAGYATAIAAARLHAISNGSCSSLEFQHLIDLWHQDIGYSTPFQRITPYYHKLKQEAHKIPNQTLKAFY